MQKILIITPYSYPSACGIWRRAEMDAEALISEGNDVAAFSSNILKGTNQKLSKFEEHAGIKIHRFRSWFSLGANSLFFFHFFKLIKLKPDVIHTHGYRHPHSIQALIVGKLMGKKVILTSHGPFEKDPSRSIVIKAFDFLYDILIGWWELKLYNKIILVAEWEREYIGKWVKDSKMETIPNGISQEFLEGIENRENNPMEKRNQVLFMGRLDPVKRVDWILDVAQNLPEIKFKIVGPLSGYKTLESDLENVEIIIKKYSRDEFISNSRESDIFLSTSVRESLGITMLEAMSQGNIVVATKTRGAESFIVNNENGFLVASKEELELKIKDIYENWENISSIQKNGIETAKKYSHKILNKKLIDLYNRIQL